MVFVDDIPKSYGDIQVYTTGGSQCSDLPGYETVYQDKGQTVYLSNDGSVYVPPEEPEELYRVQAGAFRERQNADNLLQLLENDGFPAFIVYQDGLYKVQVGAFSRLSNAIAMEREVREKGYNTYITT